MNKELSPAGILANYAEMALSLLNRYSDVMTGSESQMLRSVLPDAIMTVREKYPQTIEKPIQKGSVVKYKDGYMEVTAKFKNHVNLGPIFHGKTKVKHVPLSEVSEAHDEWYEKWTQSETYKSM